MPGLHEQYGEYDTDNLLQALGVATENGSRDTVYLRAMVDVRAAQLLAKQLFETARVTAESGAHINAKIDGLTSSLKDVGSKLIAASNQSSKLGRNLNRLTAAIAFAALLTAGATVFQGWETKRQADVLEKQLQLQLQPPPAPGAPAKQ